MALPGCGAPVASPGALRDGLAGSGVVFVHRLCTAPDHGDAQGFQGTFGGGVVAADLDRDGHVDLYLGSGTGSNGLFWGRGDGTFDPANSFAVGASLDQEDTAFFAAADYDGDGDLDLAAAGWQTLRLLENQGNRFFEDVSEEAGLVPPPGFSGALAWADFDQDGDLDLFAGTFGVPVSEMGTWGPSPVRSTLWVQEDGVFVDHAERLFGLADADAGLALHAEWHDLDGDADLDLVQVNDFGETRANSFLWENPGGGAPFVDRMPESGLGVLMAPMGVTYRDLDGDDFGDLVFSDIARVRAFRRVGPWSWADAEEVWLGGVSNRESDVSWSVVPVDLSGWGQPGLYLSYGPIHDAAPGTGDPYRAEQADRFLVPGGWGTSLSYTTGVVFPERQTGRARGVATADFNEDGVPDIVVNNLAGQPSLFFGECTEARRFWVSLRDDRSPGNRHAVGAEVTVTADGLVQRQELLAGGPGSASSQEPSLHFGVGNAERVDFVTVRWPDGTTSAVADLCANCRVVLSRP